MNDKVRKALEERNKRQEENQKNGDKKTSDSNKIRKLMIDDALAAREQRITMTLRSTLDDLSKRYESVLNSHNNSVATPMWGRNATDIRNGQRENMLATTDLIRDFEAYRKYFGDDATDSILASLGEIKTSQLGIYNNAEIFSQYKTEKEYNAAYKEYQRQQEEDNKLLSYDLKAGADEIASYQAVQDEMRSLMISISDMKDIRNAGKYTKADIAAAHARYKELEQKYGYWDELNNLIEEKEAYYNKAEKRQKHKQQEDYYEQFRLSPDFEEKSKYTSTYRGGEVFSAVAGMYTDTGFDDIEYDAINRNETARDRIRLADLKSGSAFLGYDKSYLYEMTDDEIAIYNSLYDPNDKTASDEYLKFLLSELNYRRRATQQQQWAQMAKEDPVGSSVFSIVMAPTKSLTALGQVADYVSDGAIDQNAGYNKFSHIPSSIRGQVASDIAESGNWGEVGSWTYQLGMSMGDFLMTTAASGGNKYLSLALMGSGAMADATIAAKDRGLSDDQAFTLGIVAGVAEIITEKFSLDALFDVGADQGVMRYILTNAITEGTEEVGSSVINLAADVIVSKDKSEWQMAIQKYLDENPDATESEAFQKVLRDEMLSLGLDFLGGTIMGEVMGSGGATINTVAQNAQYRADGSSIMGVDGGKDALMNLANEVAGVSDSKKLTKQIDKANRRTTAKNVGKLYDTVKSTNNSMNQADIAKSLERKGFSTGTANDIAEVLVASYNGQELTKTQSKLLESAKNSEVVQEAIAGIVENPNSTMGQRNQNVKKFATDIALGMLAKEAGVSVDEIKNATGNLTDTDKNAPETTYEVSDNGETILKSSGDPVSIKEIASIKDGRMTLRLEDGTEVDSNDVEYSSEAEALIYETIAEMGVSAEGANTLIRGFDTEGDMSASVYANAVNEAYQYGQMGARFEDISPMGFAMELNESLRKYAYNLGEMALATQKTSEYNNTTETEAENDGTGEWVHLRRGVQRTDSEGSDGSVRGVVEGTGAVQNRQEETAGRSGDGSKNYGKAQGQVSTKELGVPNGTEDSNLRYASEETAELKEAKEFAKKNGLELVAFEGGNLTVNGKDGVFEARAYIYGNKVVIRADHPRFSLMQLLKHEVGHHKIRKGNVDMKKVYDAIVDFATEEYVQYVIESYVTAYASLKGYDADYILEEILCDYEAGMNIFSKDLIPDSFWDLSQEILESDAVKKDSVRGPPDSGKASIDNKQEVGLYGEEGQTETQRSFLARMREGSRRIRKIGEIAVAYEPARALDTSGTVSDAAREFRRLGIKYFYHNGLEYNHNGKTHVDNGAFSAIGNKVVGIYAKAYGNGVEFAGHEAFHVWKKTTERAEYVDVLRDNINFGSSVYGIKLADTVLKEYFGDDPSALQDTNTQALFFEELYALVSGQIHSGTHEAGLRTMLKDYDAVKAAWDVLVESQVPEQTQPGKFSRESSEANTQTIINQSMTMQQAKDMVQRAFVLAGIKEWYDGQYRNGDEWLAAEGVDEVAMYIENEWQLTTKYLDHIQAYLDEEITISDIIEAYQNKTLTGKVKQPTKWMDLSHDVAVADKRFYAPKAVKDASAKLEVAKQRITRDNKGEVTKARAEILLYAHNKGAAETLGLTDAEMNRMLRSWAGYRAAARDISQRLNSGVALSNRWSGIENCSWLSKAQVSEDELARLVKSVSGDSQCFERNYIARTMLALDTHIDWSDINFVFTGVVDPNRRSVRGTYNHRERTIRANFHSPDTVAHEMGHALDHKWANDLGFSDNSTMTEGRLNKDVIKSEKAKIWYDHFKTFIQDLTDSADISSSYTMDNGEVFARFVSTFVQWADQTATGRQNYGYINSGRGDKFTGNQYIAFVKLLQEKAMLDSEAMATDGQDAKFSREFSLSDINRQINELQNKRKEIIASAEYTQIVSKIFTATGETLDTVMQEYVEFTRSSGLYDVTEQLATLEKQAEETRKQQEEDYLSKAASERKAAIESSGLTEAEYDAKQAVKEFGYTPYYYDAGFIVANGKMLNFSGEKGRHFGIRGQDHRAIGIIYDGISGTQAMIKFMNEGNVRIMDESPGLDISTMPTKEQMSTIKKYVASKHGEIYLDISDTEGRNVASVEYDRGTSPSIVELDIKEYFEKGKIPEKFEPKFSREFVREQMTEKEKLLEKANQTLERENSKLQEDNQYLKELVKLQKTVTGGAKFTKTSIESAAKILKKQANVKANADTKALAKLLEDFYGYIAKGDDITWESVMEQAQPVVDWLQKNEKSVFERDQYAQEVLDLIKGRSFYIDDVQKGEAKYAYGSYQAFRQKLLGTFTVSDNARGSLDSFWKEMSENHPYYFPEDVTGGDQVTAIVDTLSSLRNAEAVPEDAGYEQEMKVRDLLYAVYDSYWNVSTLYTAADVKQKEINRLKMSHSKKLSEIRSEHNSQTKKLKEYYQKRIRELREEYRERTERKQQKIIEAYQASKKKAIETRDKREAREKLQKLVLDTVKWISYPSKTDVKCPDILKQPYSDFLNSIDLSSQRLANGGDPTKNDLRLTNAMSSLATALDKVMTSQDPTQETTDVLDTGYLDLPANFVEKLRDMTEEVKEMMGSNEYVVNRMPAAEVRKLTQMIRALNHAIKEVSTLYANLRFANVEALGDSTMSFVDSLGEIEKAGGIKDFVQWDNALPYYAFRRFGEGGESIFEGLMDAQDKLAFLAQKIFDFQEKAWNGKEAKAWSEDSHTIDLPNGETLTLTTADAMSIYCLSRRQHGLQHLLAGGIRVMGIQKGSKKAKDSRSLLTVKDIDTIISSLTDRQKQVADTIQEFMSTVCSEWGNEISMKRFLTKEFNEKFYFPIESNDENLSTKDPAAQQSDLFRLLNISATKPIDPRANNEVIIRNIFDVFSGHASDMARLNSYGMALLDYMKWLNYREKTVNEDGQIKVRGVRKSMGKAFGAAAKSYVLNLVKDVNGRPSDGGLPNFYTRMLKNAKTAMVGNTLRVATLQFTSYPRAALVLSPKNLALGFSKLPQIKKAKKYCGIALWKSFGFYDTNISRSIEEQIKGVKDAKQKLIELSLKGAEWGDAITWGYLWNACEYEVAATKQYKVGTEEFNQAVGKKLREVVYRTQVVDSTLTRSQMMRGKDNKAKELSAFMSEPTLSANILMDAAFQFNAEKRRTGSAKMAWKKTGSYITRAIAVYSIGQLAAALLEGLWDAWRDDDDEEFSEKFWDAFIKNLILDILPFNKIPILSEFAEAALSLLGLGYFSSDDLSSTALSQTVSAAKSWSDVLNGKTSETTYSAIYKTIRAISSFLGVSISGVMREGVDLWNNTAGAYDSTWKIRTWDLSNTELASEALDAIIEGNDRQANSIRAEFSDDDAYQSAMRTAIKDRYTAGEIDYNTAIQYLVKYGGMEEDDAFWRVDEWMYEIETSDDYDKYNEFFTAVETGKNLKAVITKYTDNGVSVETLASQITSHYKPLYIEMSTAEKANIKGYILNAMTVLGKTREEAERTVSKWEFESKYGFAYDDRAEAYKAGKISASELKNILMTVGGKTAEEADLQIQAYDWEEQGYDGVTAAAVRDYNNYCAGYSVPKDVYLHIRSFANNTKNDVDSSGKTINYSAMKKIMAEINSQYRLTSSQKTAIARSLGWSEKNIQKYKLW